MTGFLDWTDQLATGRVLSDVATGFIYSAEFQNPYGSLDDDDFVELLYQNVLGRSSDAAGKQDWLGRLGGGASQESVVLGFSQSAEFIGSTSADLVAWVRAQGLDDTLEGGRGDNVLAGGMWSDRFIFRADQAGSHQVLDLEVWDELQFTKFGYGDEDEARSHMRQSGDNVVFFDQGEEITFLDTWLAGISDDMISLLY